MRTNFGWRQQNAISLKKIKLPRGLQITSMLTVGYLEDSIQNHLKNCIPNVEIRIIQVFNASEFSVGFNHTNDFDYMKIRETVDRYISIIRAEYRIKVCQRRLFNLYTKK